MSKKDDMYKLIRFSTLALAHIIGSIVNNEASYSSKYLREYKNFLNQAKNISRKIKLNKTEEEEFTLMLKNDLKSELSKRDFLSDEKFNYIEKEVNDFIKELKL